MPILSDQNNRKNGKQKQKSRHIQPFLLLPLNLSFCQSFPAINQPKTAQTPSTSNLPDVFLEFDLEEDLKALESEAIVND